MKSVKDLLTRHPVAASAPCRVDSGGTWDIKAMALPLRGIVPTTLNVALNIRTSVALSPYTDGWIRVSSEGFTGAESYKWDRLPFDSAFGIFYAAISYFGFHGLKAHISSHSPVKSALGGSSTAMVAMIKALDKVSVMLGGKGMRKKEILHLAYQLEDGICGGNCGLQDHAAAVYGGVHQWIWHFGNRSAPYERIRLLERKEQTTLSRHILVAYSGKRHISLRTNRGWINGFLSGKTRREWIQANKIVHELAGAIKEQDWIRAAHLLKKEMDLRKKITPEALIPITEKLVEQAENTGCGARFAGAGAGGSLWALGETKNIQQLRKLWREILEPVSGARIINCEVDPAGVK